MSLVARTRPLDDDRHLLDLVPMGVTPLAWLRGADGLVAWGEAARIEPGRGPERIADAAAAFAAFAATVDVDDEVGQRGTGLVAVTACTFDDRSPGSVLVVPEVVVGRRDGRTWITRIGAVDELDRLPGPRPTDDNAHVGSHEGRGRDRAGVRRGGGRDRVRYAGSSKPDLHWLEAVADAVKRIDGGELDKVVLARDLGVWSKQPFDPTVLARRLHRRFPGCFTFVVDGLIGATPELLVARFGDDVDARVLAGTTGRADDEADDAELGARLLASDKDRREHAFAVDSVRDALAPVCDPLEEDPEPRLLRLDNVQHLATRFHGVTREPTGLLALAERLHPTAAVGGTPTGRAVELIRELEGMERGRYAGPVGWVDADGDGELGIALRCAELSGARARLFAGVGIVAGSLPEAELEETRLKLQAMQSVLGDSPPDPGAALDPSEPD